MNDFMSLAEARQSCRNYDPARRPTREQLETCIRAARLAPSACNSQPWHFTVVNDPEVSPAVAEATRLFGLNKFTENCPAYVVVCEQPARLMRRVTEFVSSQHYAQMDVGIATAHLCYAAAAQGLSTCVMGCFDEARLRELLPLPAEGRVRLVLAVGFAAQDPLREKVRKPLEEICTYVGE